ncbi:glycoside hydrolase family 18 protein [Hebeloma cylindrosporum]|uniref:chitinase n=1 Tax=Hebeloma cylindrosporum TaxID=76867 RepID=A0A0C2Z584_HEBCY|nr:glycoside hydrolase family 18 protein [Hebeloma cylindrosporum h7]
MAKYTISPASFRRIYPRHDQKLPHNHDRPLCSRSIDRIFLTCQSTEGLPLYFKDVSPWTSLILAVCLALCANEVGAFSSDRNDNMAVYWGQDSAGHQQRLGFYCDDDTIDAIPLAFLYIFFGKGGEPVMDFSNICSQGTGNFKGTDLADCSFMASDIQKCQKKGKILTLSLGGAIANVGFSSDAQAAGFAKTIWDMFLGGNGPMRPFGNAVLDGVDLDIENGSAAHYSTFVNALRSLAKNSRKRYYVTAAPQCPFPDAQIGNALNNAFFDAVYVQFYNNFCEVSVPSEFNMATWDRWAKTRSPNKNIKVYLGAPASQGAAGNGYVSSQNLINVVRTSQKKYSSFGGVMLWDADSAYTNGRYHVLVKNGIRNRSGSPGDPTSPNPDPTEDPATALPGTPTTPNSPSGPDQTDIPDPRYSGRVKPPATAFAKRSEPTTLSMDSPGKRFSRFFKF